MKKRLSLLMTLMISAGVASLSHADDNFDPPNIPLPTTTTAPATLEEQVERNAENISVNTDDVITNIYSIYENTVKIDDLDSRVISLENSGSSNNNTAADYEGFSMPFSESGQPRNIVVLRRESTDGSGSTTYNLRLRYENSDGQTLTINGADRTFAYLAVYGSVTVGSNGDIIYISKFVDGTDDTSYTTYAGGQINYDPSTLTPIVDQSPRTYEVTDIFYGEGAIRNVANYTTSYTGTSAHNSNSIILRTYVLGIGYEANGINFGQTPFRVEHRSRGAGRIRVKGIGTVEQFTSGSSGPNRVIYYNVDSQTGGSLSGTPFEVGSPIYNLFLFN